MERPVRLYGHEPQTSPPYAFFESDVANVEPLLNKGLTLFTTKGALATTRWGGEENKLRESKTTSNGIEIIDKPISIPANRWRT